MTCEDYDAFVAEYGNGCAICGRTGPETGHGFLVIDHHAYTGDWAVRGLLCSSCNSRIVDGRPATAADAAYLADPWYKRRFAALGLSLTPLPEPGIGGMIAIEQKRRQLWHRTTDGWRRVGNFHESGYTWFRLNQKYGPHRIEIVSGQLAMA
jgi:hypothetical protein